VFLGYSSSHFDYRCLDLASPRICVSRHVRFHEDVFSFTNSEQITHTPVPSTQPTHLPTLNPPQNVQPTASQPCQTNTHVLPSVAAQQTHRLLADSASTKSPPNPAILSPFSCFSNDHYVRIGSPSPDVHASKSAAE
jgi:hypothetical protein